MRANLLPERKYQPGFSPTIVNTGKELILIDTVNGSNGFVPRLWASLAPVFRRRGVARELRRHRKLAA